MKVSKQTSLNGYVFSLVLAMGLNIASFPEWLHIMNPDWLLLMVIYWTLAIPEKIGVFNAWFVGLLVDSLTGRMLGEHALIYALVSYVTLQLHKRLRQYVLPQQALYVLVCLFFARTMTFWIENIEKDLNLTLMYWLPVLTGMLCWPLVCLLLRLIRNLRLFG